MSELVIWWAQSKQDTSSANEYESFIVKSFYVIGINNGAGNVASLYDVFFFSYIMNIQ